MSECPVHCSRARVVSRRHFRSLFGLVSRQSGTRVCSTSAIAYVRLNCACAISTLSILTSIAFIAMPWSARLRLSERRSGGRLQRSLRRRRRRSASRNPRSTHGRSSQARFVTRAHSRAHSCCFSHSIKKSHILVNLDLQ